jgi:hypothetical protein
MADISIRKLAELIQIPLQRAGYSLDIPQLEQILTPIVQNPNDDEGFINQIITQVQEEVDSDKKRNEPIDDDVDEDQNNDSTKRQKQTQKAEQVLKTKEQPPNLQTRPSDDFEQLLNGQRSASEEFNELIARQAGQNQNNIVPSSTTVAKSNNPNLPQALNISDTSDEFKLVTREFSRIADLPLNQQRKEYFELLKRIHPDVRKRNFKFSERENAILDEFIKEANRDFTDNKSLVKEKYASEKLRETQPSLNIDEGIPLSSDNTQDQYKSILNQLNNIDNLPPEKHREVYLNLRKTLDQNLRSNYYKFTPEQNLEINERLTDANKKIHALRKKKPEDSQTTPPGNIPGKKKKEKADFAGRKLNYVKIESTTSGQRFINAYGGIVESLLPKILESSVMKALGNIGNSIKNAGVFTFAANRLKRVGNFSTKPIETITKPIENIAKDQTRSPFTRTVAAISYRTPRIALGVPARAISAASYAAEGVTAAAPGAASGALIGGLLGGPVGALVGAAGAAIPSAGIAVVQRFVNNRANAVSAWGVVKTLSDKLPSKYAEGFRREMAKTLSHMNRGTAVGKFIKASNTFSAVKALKAAPTWTLGGLAAGLVLGNPIIGGLAATGIGVSYTFAKNRFPNTFASPAVKAIGAGGTGILAGAALGAASPLIGGGIVGAVVGAALGGAGTSGFSYLNQKFPRSFVFKGATGGGMGASAGAFIAPLIGINPVIGLAAGAGLGIVSGGASAMLSRNTSTGFLKSIGAAGPTLLGIMQGGQWAYDIRNAYLENRRKGMDDFTAARLAFFPNFTVGMMNIGMGAFFASDLIHSGKLMNGFTTNIALAGSRFSGVRNVLVRIGGGSIDDGARALGKIAGRWGLAGTIIGGIIGIATGSPALAVGLAVGGGIAGAAAGGVLGGAAGGFVGSFFAGVGAVPGAAIGAKIGTFIGGFFGSIGGDALGKFIMDRGKSLARGVTGGLAALQALFTLSNFDPRKLNTPEGILSFIFAILALASSAKHLQDDTNTFSPSEDTQTGSFWDSIRNFFDNLFGEEHNGSFYVYASQEPFINSEMNVNTYKLIDDSSYTKKPNTISRIAEQKSSNLEKGFWGLYNKNNSKLGSWNQSKYVDWSNCSNFKSNCRLDIEKNDLYWSQDLIYDVFSDIYEFKQENFYSPETIKTLVEREGEYVKVDDRFNLNDLDSGNLVFFAEQNPHLNNDQIPVHVGILHSIDKDFLKIIEANSESIENHYTISFKSEELNFFNSKYYIIGFGNFNTK